MPCCAQAGVSGWTTDGSPLMVERLGRADLAGITREGEDLQRMVLYSCVPATPCGCVGWAQLLCALGPRVLVLVLVCRYMLYLETMFRTCTRLSRERYVKP